MRITAEQRNQKVSGLFHDLIIEAQELTGETSYPEPFAHEEVEMLFSSHIFGHREITLTIILSRLLDPKYKASKDFYDCNPRAIYEGPIRQLLSDYGIPHKKSGPLNVAKNSQRIDEVWAHNKRGDGMALIVAKMVKKIESVPPDTLRAFAVVYIQRYLKEAQKVAQLSVTLQKVEDPIFLGRLCSDLIKSVPDGGATPQLIIGVLLEHSNAAQGSPIVVSGHTDSVSTTNTTSGKPGDIIEEIPGQQDRIYEVTVKEFSLSRIKESYEAIRDLEESGASNEVFVICRKEDLPDVATRLDSGILLGTADYQDIRYYFFDIFEFIWSKIVLMNGENRLQFYADLIAYINDLNTSEKVKIYFKQWHEEHPLTD